jgi:predicted AlkP superfamily pyrophosphatase or phosphodiesterase
LITGRRGRLRTAPGAAGVLFLLFGAVAALPPPATQRPSGSHAARAILVSFDGVSGERLAEMLERGALPDGGFRSVAERGVLARRSRPPTPSLTAVAHVTHVTGALPEKTGVVANEMLDFSRPFGTKLSGFDAPIRADTLWQAARRQGLRVGIVAYPGADGAAPERRGDFGLAWVYFGATTARIEKLPASAWGNAADPRSFSPARSARIAFPPTAHAATVTALDTTDDGRANYDRLRIESEVGPPVTAAVGDWFPVEVRGEKARTGAWCKLLRLEPDLSRTEIYVGGLYSNRAYPDDFRRDLDAEVGFWPGKPEDKYFGADSANPGVYLEQAERLGDYLTRATLFAAARMEWSVLLVYEPQVDEISHVFLLTDPKQTGYTAERAKRFRGYVEGAYRHADRALDSIVRALRPEDAVVVTSDHGLVPVRTAVYVNEILREAGLLRLDAKGEVDPESAAVAMAGSGVANVFVNPKKAPPGTLDRVESVLEGFRVAGESPWDRVVRRADAGPLGLNAPESGDLIALARPGFAVSMSIEAGRTSGRPLSYGGHGYRNAFPALDATFLAAGPGIARERIEEFPSWRIAGFLSRVLGIDPPRDAAP